jgi:hypothetical protein
MFLAVHSRWHIDPSKKYKCWSGSGYHIATEEHSGPNKELIILFSDDEEQDAQDQQLEDMGTISGEHLPIIVCLLAKILLAMKMIVYRPGGIYGLMYVLCKTIVRTM